MIYVFGAEVVQRLTPVFIFGHDTLKAKRAHHNLGLGLNSQAFFPV
jgi:hypothetical protein